MRRTLVESSQISSIGYDPTKSLLEIQFKNAKGEGPVYEYYNVPAEAHAALMAAESKGRHFRQAVKGVYGYKKVS